MPHPLRYRKALAAMASLDSHDHGVLLWGTLRHKRKRIAAVRFLDARLPVLFLAAKPLAHEFITLRVVEGHIVVLAIAFICRVGLTLRNGERSLFW